MSANWPSTILNNFRGCPVRSSGWAQLRGIIPQSQATGFRCQLTSARGYFPYHCLLGLQGKWYMLLNVWKTKSKSTSFKLASPLRSSYALSLHEKWTLCQDSLWKAMCCNCQSTETDNKTITKHSRTVCIYDEVQAKVVTPLHRPDGMFWKQPCSFGLSNAT